MQNVPHRKQITFISEDRHPHHLHYVVTGVHLVRCILNANLPHTAPSADHRSTAKPPFTMKLSSAWSVCSKPKSHSIAYPCLSHHASNHRHEGREESPFFITSVSLPFASLAKAFPLEQIWQSKIARIHLFLLVLLSSCLPPALSYSGTVFLLLDMFFLFLTLLITLQNVNFLSIGQEVGFKNLCQIIYIYQETTSPRRGYAERMSAKSILSKIGKK